eukprot:5864254-Ditylum_brightwellii.AAC.1
MNNSSNKDDKSTGTFDNIPSLITRNNGNDSSTEGSDDNDDISIWSDINYNLDNEYEANRGKEGDFTFADVGHIQKKAKESGWGTAWFHRNIFVNILTLHEAKEKWRVTYNSEGGNIFTIHKLDHNVIFQQSLNGLYYQDASDRNVVMPDKVKEDTDHVMLVITVETNKDMFSQRQIEKSRGIKDIAHHGGQAI